MREHTNYLMHRNPGSANAGLAMTNLWAYGNSVIHLATITHPLFRLKHILRPVNRKDHSPVTEGRLNRFRRLGQRSFGMDTAIAGRIAGTSAIFWRKQKVQKVRTDT
jgi:hypothetical protein